MTERLKSPETAKFAITSEGFGHDGKKVVIVKGDMVARSALGGMQTTKIIGYYLDVGDGYNLDSALIDGGAMQDGGNFELVWEIVEGHVRNAEKLGVE